MLLQERPGRLTKNILDDLLDLCLENVGHIIPDEVGHQLRQLTHEGGKKTQTINVHGNGSGEDEGKEVLVKEG